MSEKKIDLIAQLLAKAESTTPEEAEALTEHAERLMVKYGIEQAVIDSRRAKKGEASEKIIQFRMDFTGAYRGEMVHMAHAVGMGLGNLQGLRSPSQGKVFTYWFVGFESDVQQAVLLMNSLQVQAAVAVREWWKGAKGQYAAESSYDQEKARRSFVHGFGSGAGSRIYDSRATIVEEQTAGTALVLVDRKTKVDEYYSTLGAKSSRGNTATGRDGAAAQGRVAGRNANTGGKSVSQGRGLGA